MRGAWLVLSTVICAATVYGSWDARMATLAPIPFAAFVVVPCVVIPLMPWFLGIWKK